MNTLTRNGHTITVIDPGVNIVNAQDLLDLFVTANYEHGSIGIIVYKDSLNEDFFDLKTRVAGELLQKCSNYNVRFAIVGDFSSYTSKSLRDFIYECNKGNLVFFKCSIEDALTALTY